MRVPKPFLEIPTVETAGWTLLSAEERHLQHPTTFHIPTRRERETLKVGDAAYLLFDIETRDGGKMVDRGVDKMWVIVKRTGRSYAGVLDNDPGLAENLDLRPGDLIPFDPQHVCSIATPPREYVLEKYGPDFFDQS